MQVNPLLLKKIYFLLLIYPEYLPVPLVLEVFAAPELLYLESASLMQFRSPGLTYELLHHFEQHPIGPEPSILFLGINELNLAGFLKELHKEVSVDLTLGIATVHTLNLQSRSHSIIG